MNNWAANDWGLHVYNIDSHSVQNVFPYCYYCYQIIVDFVIVICASCLYCHKIVGQCYGWTVHPLMQSSLLSIDCYPKKIMIENS